MAIARTPRPGIHLVMKYPDEPVKNSVKAKLGNIIADIRANGAFVLAAPSVTYGRYKWVNGFELNTTDLDVFDPRWIERKEVKCLKVEDDTILRIVRARLYATTVEGAVSGCGGHNRTYRLACKLRRDFALSVDQALPILLEWNEKCQPKWSLRTDPQAAHREVIHARTFCI